MPLSRKKRARSHPGVELLLNISREEYGRALPRLGRLLSEVEGLYTGRWPSHEACEVPYHDFAHALDAAVAVARMAAGWNRAHPEIGFSKELFCSMVAAGLFHDSGYIKDKGDHDGLGGKFTLTHVQRGMKIASDYLTRSRWPAWAVRFVTRAISLTDYQQEPDINKLFSREQELAAARIIPTADLIAQIADNRYIEKLDGLFAEFKEMYEHQDQRRLAADGTPVFRSAQEIRDGIISFYEGFVAPRLNKFGHMDRYLAVYFGSNRNPYHENIAANLSSHLLGDSTRWQHLADVLRDLGLIDDRQLRQAANRQKKNDPGNRYSQNSTAIKSALLSWLERRNTGDGLGDILLEMKAVDTVALADGILHQNLPDRLLNALKADDLRVLLQIAVLIQHLHKGPWLLEKIMLLLNKLLLCEAGSLMLAEPEGDELLIVLPTGPCGPDLLGHRIPVDKGLAGWVFRNGKPALAANVLGDQRFDRSFDRKLNFTTRSLLAVPLHIGDECLGVLEAVNKNSESFDEHDLRLLTVAANMLAGALSNLIPQTAGNGGHCGAGNHPLRPKDLRSSNGG